MGLTRSGLRRATAAESPSTPLMRQYHAIKQQVPNALLMFRLGDFYELFYDDAVTAARELEITLTSRNKEKGASHPHVRRARITRPKATSRGSSRKAIASRSAIRWKTPRRQEAGEARSDARRNARHRDRILAAALARE